MNIVLEKNEVDFVMNVLGELPTKSGAFLLLQKIAAQVQTQTTSEEIKPE
jgi:hypothetical protein